MKALVLPRFGGPEQLVFSDVAKPTSNPGQVLVRVIATSLNPVDLKRAAGTMQSLLPVALPFIPGGDFSGVVDEVGAGVTQFQPGDEVYGYSFAGGAYAEFIAIDADRVALKPQSLSHAEAASVCMVAQTASQALVKAELRAGQTILILGAGGAGGAVGSVAVQLAKQRNAHVIAVARFESAARLQAYGADEIIQSGVDPFDSVTMRVDVVLDLLGGEYQRRAFSVLKAGGILIAASQPPPQEEAAKYGVRATMLQTESSSRSLTVLRGELDSGRIRPFVGRMYPMRDIPKAWADKRDKHIEGKIIFYR